jgi:hypothetical protein
MKMAKLTPEQEEALSMAEEARQQEAKAIPPLIPAFQNFTEDVQRIFASSATRGASERVTAAMAGSTFEKEKQKTREARERRPYAGGVADVAGTVAPALALGAPATALGGAALGAGIGAGDTALRAGVQGELPGATDMAVGTTLGAAGGLVGHLLGRGVERYLRGRGLSDKPLSEAGRKQFTMLKSVENEAGDAMDASGVVVGGPYLARIAREVHRNLIPDGLSKEGTPTAWRALLTMKRGMNGRDLSLRQLNTLRIRVRDMAGASTPGTEAHLIREMEKSIGSAIKGLAKGKGLRAGDAAKGVQAWDKMNNVHMEAQKAQLLTRMLYKAELVASQRGKGVSIGQALQENAINILSKTTKKGLSDLRLFNDVEKKTLEELARGNMTTGFENMIDRYLGHRILTAPLRGGAKATSMVATKVIGGGDAATKEAAMKLLTGKIGADVPQTGLTQMGAAVGSRLAEGYKNRKARLDALLDAERAKVGMGGQ